MTSFETGKSGSWWPCPPTATRRTDGAGTACRHCRVTAPHCSAKPACPPHHPLCPALHGPTARSAPRQGSWRQTPPPCPFPLHLVWHPPWHVVGGCHRACQGHSTDAEQALSRPRCVTTLMSQQRTGPSERARAENRGKALPLNKPEGPEGDSTQRAGSQEENRPQRDRAYGCPMAPYRKGTSHELGQITALRNKRKASVLSLRHLFLSTTFENVKTILCLRLHQAPGTAQRQRRRKHFLGSRTSAKFMVNSPSWGAQALGRDV